MPSFGDITFGLFFLLIVVSIIVGEMRKTKRLQLEEDAANDMWEYNYEEVA